MWIIQSRYANLSSIWNWNDPKLVKFMMKEKIYRVKRSVQKKYINELRDDNSKYGEDKNFKV